MGGAEEEANLQSKDQRIDMKMLGGSLCMCSLSLVSKKAGRLLYVTLLEKGECTAETQILPFDALY